MRCNYHGAAAEQMVQDIWMESTQKFARQDFLNSEKM
jgi:hypothetical protein